MSSFFEKNFGFHYRIMLTLPLFFHQPYALETTLLYRGREPPKYCFRGPEVLTKQLR